MARKHSRRNEGPMVLKVRPVPIPADVSHPEAPHHFLLKHEHALGVIAPAGGGKTTLLINLLHFYRQYFHDIWILSPTVESDEKWDWVKKENLLSDNLAKKKYIESKKLDKDDAIVGKLGVAATKRTFDPKIPEDHFVPEYDMGFIQGLLHDSSEEIKALKSLARDNDAERAQAKYLADRKLLFCDDMVGSGLFTRKHKDAFKTLNANRRHHSISMWMVSQKFKEFPTLVRDNWSGIIIFEIPNQSELKQIYEEFSNGLSEEQWMAAYNYCIKEPHGFMYINMRMPKDQRIMKNFEQILYFSNEDSETE